MGENPYLLPRNRNLVYVYMWIDNKSYKENQNYETENPR